MSSIDLEYLAKLKRTLTTKQIAARLGVPEEEVVKQIKSLEEKEKLPVTNGYPELVGQFNGMCYLYSLIGEHLKALGNGISHNPKPEEIAKIIQENPDPTTAACLILTSFIVIKPFTPVDVEKAFEAHLKVN